MQSEEPLVEDEDDDDDDDDDDDNDADDAEGNFVISPLFPHSIVFTIWLARSNNYCMYLSMFNDRACVTTFIALDDTIDREKYRNKNEKK